MAWWGLFSAMFWLYVGAASADAVGAVDTVIGLVLSIATYGVINAVLSRYSARTGQSVELLSRRIFGLVGAVVAPLLLAATALYYAVFEGSIVAVSFHQYFGGSLDLWYLACVAYMVPLVIGGISTWLDKLNGVLLPFYVLGMVAAVIAATVKQGAPQHIFSGVSASGPLPGWATSYLIYMGVWILMMYTVDYARLGKSADQRFHARVTFGWVFYAFTFGVNALVGIYLLASWHIGGSETGVVDAIIKSLGFVGVLLILVSQTRINSANYFLASDNLRLVGRMAGLRAPRAVWVVVVGVIAYIMMLTDVLSYLLQALAWQGVLITGWVAIVLVYIGVRDGAATSITTMRRVAVGSWVVSSIVGIVLLLQDAEPVAAQIAPVVTVVLAGGIYGAGLWIAGRRPARELVHSANAPVPGQDS